MVHRCRLIALLGLARILLMLSNPHIKPNNGCLFGQVVALSARIALVCGKIPRSIRTNYGLQHIGTFDAGDIVGISIGILVVLFFFQHIGTKKIGFLFSPIILIWVRACSAAAQLCGVRQSRLSITLHKKEVLVVSMIYIQAD
jgi:hypothetical protein